MKKNENTCASENITLKEKTSPTVNLFYIQLTVCVLILCLVIILKFNSSQLFDAFKLWYESNILEEKYCFEEIKEIVLRTIMGIWYKVHDLACKIYAVKFNL